MPISPLLKYSPLLMTTSVMASNTILPNNNSPIFSPGKVTYETTDSSAYQSAITNTQLEKVREHFGHLVASNHINSVRRLLPKYATRSYHYPLQIAKAEANIILDPKHLQKLPIVWQNKPDYNVKAQKKQSSHHQTNPNKTTINPKIADVSDLSDNEHDTQHLSTAQNITVKQDETAEENHDKNNNPTTTDDTINVADNADINHQTNPNNQMLTFDNAEMVKAENLMDNATQMVNTIPSNTPSQPVITTENTNSIAPVVNPSTVNHIHDVNATPNIGEVQNALKQQLHQIATANYDLAQLQQNPVEFTKFLNIALAAKDLKTVKDTLPTYKQLSINDPFLIQYADAFIARSEGKNKQAIDIYRKMLANDPNLPPVRLNLAQALYADQQLDFAKQQFIQLRAEPNIPIAVKQLADDYLTQIDNQTKVKSYVTAQFVKSKNLNNVPETPIDTSFGTSVKPIDDTGFRVNVGASKRIPLKANFYTEIGFNGNHTHYFKQDDFNESNANLAVSFGYANAKTDIQIKPNISKRFYGNSQLNTQNSIALSGTHWINPKVRLGLVTQYGKRKHENIDYHIQDGDNHYIGANGLYLLNGKSYIFGGISRYHNNTKSPDDYLSYVQLGINAGIGTEWQKGVSTILSGGYHELQYQGINDLFVEHNAQPKERRQDKVLNLGLTAWKRDWHFLGFTPKINLEYNRTNSNYSYYQRAGNMMVNAFVSRDF